MNVHDLLDAIDLDDLDELETFLMILYERPVRLVLKTETDEPGLEVIVAGEHWSTGTLLTFPISVENLAKDGYNQETADSMEPYPGAGSFQPGDLAALPPAELDATFIKALGTVRLYGMLE